MLEIQLDKTTLESFFKATGELKKIVGSNKLCQTGARELVNEIRRNIDEQTFGDFGKPFNEKWRKQKLSTNPAYSERFWYWWGTLYKSIRSKKVDDREYKVYIESKYSVKDRGNPSLYAIELEERRPLFSKSVNLYLKQWNENIKKLQKEMKKAWKKK